MVNHSAYRNIERGIFRSIVMSAYLLWRGLRPELVDLLNTRTEMPIDTHNQLINFLAIVGVS